jgi:hypothetical protein
MKKRLMSLTGANRAGSEVRVGSKRDKKGKRGKNSFFVPFALFASLASPLALSKSEFNL